MSPSVREQLQSVLGETYAIERELGGGGMSRVFVAEEIRLGRRVVIKVLDPALGAAVSAARFEREIRVAARLQDPRIVPVLSAGDVHGLPFYTMPFVDGESLRARLARGRVPIAECIAILRDVAVALEYAHAAGVVHRDIKPENILLSGGGGRGATDDGTRVTPATAVVTDFGIAKAIAAANAAGDRPDGVSRRDLSTQLTSLGLALGTPAYMAPEQAVGDAGVDARADIYAWGVVAFELLTGQHPFGPRPSSQAMIAAHLSEPPPALGDRAPQVPAALGAAVATALRKDPAERQRDASALVRVLSDPSLLSGGLVTRPASRKRRWAMALAAGAAVAAAAVAYSLTNGDGAVRSIAVMPFTDAGADTSAAYLGSGMADALTLTLAKLPGLRVVSNRSAAALPGRTFDALRAGRELNVDAVLEGSVRREQSRLRIKAQLTRVADGAVIWGERYDHSASTMFDLEDSVTAVIVSELRERLGGGTAAVAATSPRGTSDQTAYDLYLRGRYAWSKRGERGLRAAIDLFQQAVARDPTFARAHAGLAMAYVVLPVFTTAVGADSGLALAQRSANRALALDSSLADAHLAMAYGLKMRWQWDEAERHFRAAAALAPDDATVHHWYGVHLFARGDADRSLQEFRRARELDPFATTVATDGAIAYYAARQLPDARREINRSMSLDSTRSDTWYIQGAIQLAQGAADSALVSFANARRLGTGFDLRAFSSVAYRRLGRMREADSAYADVRRDYELGRAQPLDFAVAALGAGDSAVTLRALERVVEQRDMLVTEVSFPCEPLFDPIRSNPKFQQLLAAAGMMPCHPR